MRFHENLKLLAKGPFVEKFDPDHSVLHDSVKVYSLDLKISQNIPLR